MNHDDLAFREWQSNRATIARLTAENARYREALTEIAHGKMFLPVEWLRIARRALADTDTAEQPTQPPAGSPGPRYATDAEVAGLLAENRKRFAKSLDALAKGSTPASGMGET